MAKNQRVMNDLFGKTRRVASLPDNQWPLANELVGVEIEVEDLVGNADNVYPEWSVHADHSLRNGIEFVTSGPVGGRQLTETLDKFFNAGYRYTMSPRTSVHIHVNGADGMTVDKFRNLFVIMYLIEPAVFRWADENRKWCGYCAPLTDLDPWRIVSILNENRNDGLFVRAVKGSNNQDRYYGLNVSSYHKHGTIEFRYFPCTDNKETLASWIKLVMYVKQACRVYEDPSDILARLTSRERLHQFIEQNLGVVANNIINNLDFDDCLGRAKELTGMLGVDPNLLIDVGAYRTRRSKGLSKFLARTFPKVKVETAAPSIQRAKSKINKAEDMADVIRYSPQVQMRIEEFVRTYQGSQFASGRLDNREAAAVEEVARPAPPADYRNFFVDDRNAGR